MQLPPSTTSPFVQSTATAPTSSTVQPDRAFSPVGQSQTAGAARQPEAQQQAGSREQGDGGRSGDGRATFAATLEEAMKTYRGRGTLLDISV